MSDFPTFEVVRPYDPALKLSSAARGRYMVTRDPELLRDGIREGKKPLRFRCRPLTRDERRMVMRFSSDAERYELSYRYGVIELLDVEDNGKCHPALQPQRQDDNGLITDESLNRLESQYGIGDNDIQDIGSVIFERSFLGKGVPLWCPQLDSSLRACGAQSVSLAEQSKDSGTAKGGRSD